MKLNITKLDLIVSEGYQNENSMRKKDNKSEKQETRLSKDWDSVLLTCVIDLMKSQKTLPRNPGFSERTK